MNRKNQHKQQLSYFNREFANIANYKLDAWQKNYIRKIRQNLLDEDFKKKTLLDIGTGTGYIAVEMAKLGLKVIACDLSPKAIENLEKYKKKFNLKNLKLIVCDAEEIPLKDRTVNYIVCNALLEHLPNESKAIKEWKRLLKDGGKILITVPLSLKFVWPFLWIINIIHDKKLGHLRRYSRKSLASKIKLKIIKTFYTGHLIKVFGVIVFNILLQTNKYDNFLEQIDSKSQHIQYGASNISMIFKNK